LSRRSRQGIAVPCLVDAQARERRHAAHGIDGTAPRQRAASRIRAQGERDRPGEARDPALRGVERADPHRRRDRRPDLRVGRGHADFGETSRQVPPESRLTFQGSVPLPVLESIRLSSCGAELPFATLTRTCPGATVSAAVEGGLLISLSSLQAVRRTASTDAATPIAHRLVTGRLRDLWTPRGGSTKFEWTRSSVCKART